MKPLAIDLFCGLGGWTEGLLAEGYDVIGFDIEQHVYGEDRYPAQLVIQDVLTLHGSQFKNADLIVGSSPCQEFSYRAMPWKRAKALGPPELGMKLFHAQFRIQREASEAKGERVPMVVENVRGAIPWVGRSRANFGSYHLWGDVPALMPMTAIRGPSEAVKRPGRTMCYPAGSANPDAVKGRSGKLHWQDETGVKAKDHNGYERDHPQAFGGKKPRTSSRGNARKAATAKIAKIPLPLSRWIGRAWLPEFAR